MDIAEQIDLGVSSYHFLLSEMDELYELVYKNTDLVEMIDKDSFMSSLAFLVQKTLLRTLMIDGYADKNELSFIDELGSIGPNLKDLIVTLGKKEDEAFYFSKMTDLVEAPMKVIETIVSLINEYINKNIDSLAIMFAYADLNTKRDYMYILESTLNRIFNTFCCIDGDPNEYEKKLTYRIIEDEILLPIKKAFNQLNESANKSKVKKKELDKKLDFQINTKSLNNPSPYMINATSFDEIMIKGVLYLETKKSCGTGFIISRDGLFITCAHVVKGEMNIKVKENLNEEDERYLNATLLAIDEIHDIAILKIEGDNDHYYFNMELDYHNISLGESICILGYPFGKALNCDVNELCITLTKGFIASHQKINNEIIYLLDGDARCGNSGGPVISEKTGKVIGFLCGSISLNNDRNQDICYMRVFNYFKEQFLIK